MMKRLRIFIAVSVLISLCGCGAAENTAKAPEAVGEFKFNVMKVGQADAIVLQTENHSVIIDCGETDDGDDVAKYLADSGISNVDTMFITHFDKDHVGGFPKIAENISIGNIYVPNYEGSNGEYKKYLKTVEEKQLTVTTLTEDMSFVLDDVLFEVSVPKKNDYKESDNDFSLVISITHGENTFLFAGDAEEERLSEVLKEFGHKYDFLKVPHHGKYNKKTTQFIKTVRPSYSVITDSKKNPAEEKTTSALEKAGSEIYSTKDGNVYVTSDGKKISITQ